LLDAHAQHVPNLPRLRYGLLSPVDEDQLIIVNDNEEQQFMAAFDKATGDPLWRIDRDLQADAPRRSGWATPYLWRNPMRTELVTVGPGHVVSYDLKGSELWRLSGVGMMAIPMPFAYDGLLYADAGQGRPLFAVRPGATGNITPSSIDEPGESVVWIKPRAGTYLPTPVAYDGAIYVLNNKGILARYDAASGEETFKGRVTRDDNAFTSSPWAYNGKIFSVSETGNTYVVSASGDFELLHVNALGEMVQATPAIVGDRLLLRTETRLYSIRSEAEANQLGS
jgi:outer membrane protein assembly factor BamB